MTVQTRRIELSALRVRQPKVDRVKSSEASLRLDAVASAGFRMSRSKLADLVKSGDVRSESVMHLHSRRPQEQWMLRLRTGDWEIPSPSLFVYEIN